jgi:hypothetical protein
MRICEQLYNYFQLTFESLVLVYSPTETLVEFDFGCKFNNNNRRIRFYHEVITFVINTTTSTCNIPA